MKRKKLLVVVGAGASIDLDMPSLSAMSESVPFRVGSESVPFARMLRVGAVCTHVIVIKEDMLNKQENKRLRSII